MRAVRRSGPDGLAGMAAVVEQPEVRVLRPLLGIARAQLTATLLGRGVAWLDDPSNADPRFERARLRAGKALPMAVPAGGKERPLRERSLAAAAVDTLEFQDDGSTAIDRATFVRLGRDSQARLLSRVTQAVSGGRPPAAAGSPGAGRTAPLCARGPRKVRQGPGFHTLGVPIAAAAGPAKPPTMVDCSPRAWQERCEKRGPAPDSSCIFRLRRAPRFPFRMSPHPVVPVGKSREPFQP
jgi:hypothetical protein